MAGPRLQTRRTPALMAPALLALTLLFMASGVDGQTRRAAVGLLGGGSVHSDLTPGLATSSVLQPGWLAGVQAETWLGRGRAGLRLNGMFTRRALEEGPGDFNVYMADVDLLVRMLPVRSYRLMAPYVVAGAGATHYAGVGDSPVIADGEFGDDPVYRVHLLAGAGLDVLAGAGAGLRLELADQIVLPSVGESPNTVDGLPVTHNVVLTAGVQLKLGQLRRGVAMDRARPAPATPAAVAPAATPVPTAAAPAPARPVAAAPAGEADAAALFTVQVGSYVEAATAARWAALLRERDIPVWLLQTAINGERVSRVRIGAARSEADARSLAAALEREFGWSVHVDRIAPGERYPEDAVAATRAFLYGG